MATWNTASAARTVLEARDSPHAAVLVVVLRGGHWPYSCGLASTVRRLAPRLSAAGSEVLLLAAEPPETRKAIASAWQLPFRWLPQTAAEPIGRELGAWDQTSGRLLDSLGLLGPDGCWLLRQVLDEPGATGSPQLALSALRDAGLRPVPAPPPTAPATAAPPGTAVRDPEHIAGTLRRALAGADLLARRLPPASPAALRAHRLRLRLALYLDAVQDLVPCPGPGPQ